MVGAQRTLPTLRIPEGRKHAGTRPPLFQTCRVIYLPLHYHCDARRHSELPLVTPFPCRPADTCPLDSPRLRHAPRGIGLSERGRAGQVGVMTGGDAVRLQTLDLLAGLHPWDVPRKEEGEERNLPCTWCCRPLPTPCAWLPPPFSHLKRKYKCLCQWKKELI